MVDALDRRTAPAAGQAQVKQLQYGPLPPTLLAKDLAQLKTLKCNGSPLP